MKLWHWVKNHPAEAMALAMGTALTGGAAAGVLGAGEIGAGAIGADALGAGVADATAGGAFAGAADAVGGAYGAGAAGAGAAGAADAGVGGSALLAMQPAGEDFAAQMAGNTIAGTAGGDALAGGGSALLGDFPAPSSVAGAGAESSLYGPNVATDPASALDSRSWWDKYMANKLKDPKTIMRLGMMTAQMGAPRQQGGPMGGQYQQSAYRPALHSQEDITKAWLMRNDPNTYRRIYGPPSGVA